MTTSKSRCAAVVLCSCHTVYFLQPSARQCGCGLVAVCLDGKVLFPCASYNGSRSTPVVITDECFEYLNVKLGYGAS